MEENSVNMNTGIEEPGTPPERTFTQAEVDALIGRRLAKAMKGMPGEEDLSAFRAWQKERREQSEELEAVKKERDEARAELERSRRERLLMGKGLNAEEAEFYAFKLGRLVTEERSFEQAAEDFFREARPAGRMRVELGARLGGDGRPATANETMNSLIRGKR